METNALIALTLILIAIISFSAFIISQSQSIPTSTSTTTFPPTTTLTTFTAPTTLYTSLPTNDTIQNITLNSSWIQAIPYPAKIDDLSCVSSSGYIYCIGGSLGSIGPDVNSVYFAPLASNGSIGSWTATNSYPIQMCDLSCNIYSNNIYCIGGMDLGGHDYSTVFYASILAQGVSNWIATTSYPIAPHNHACRIYNGYIYCIGGRVNGTDTNLVYYAPILSSNAIGTWLATTPYPTTIEDQACNILDGYIYCVNGYPNAPTYGIVNGINSAYYARILPSGELGSWLATTPYPIATADHKTCAISNSSLYCTGGLGIAYTNSTYYAPLTPNGIGSWSQASNHPSKLRSMSATAYNGYLYYIGGTDWSPERNPFENVITNTIYYIKTE